MFREKSLFSGDDLQPKVPRVKIEKDASKEVSTHHLDSAEFMVPLIDYWWENNKETYQDLVAQMYKDYTPDERGKKTGTIDARVWIEEGFEESYRRLANTPMNHDRTVELTEDSFKQILAELEEFHSAAGHREAA